MDIIDVVNLIFLLIVIVLFTLLILAPYIVAEINFRKIKDRNALFKDNVPSEFEKFYKKLYDENIEVLEKIRKEAYRRRKIQYIPFVLYLPALVLMMYRTGYSRC